MAGRGFQSYRLVRNAFKYRDIPRLKSSACQFSSTAWRCGNIPLFPPSSSPEISAVIESFQDQIFIPSVLPEKQRRALYKPSKILELKSNPIEVDIEGTKRFLEGGRVPWNRTWAKSNLRELISLFKEPSDWSNIPPLLEGLNSVGIPIDGGELTRLIRYAADQGRVDIILQCASQPKRTGVVLSDESHLNEVLFAIQQAAVNSEWSAEGISKALRQLDRLVLILQSSTPNSPVVAGEDDLRTASSLLSMYIELESHKAIREFDELDKDGKVKSYVSMLKSNWPHYDRSMLDETHSQRHRIGTRLFKDVFIWRGLHQAQPILVKEDSKDLANWARDTCKIVGDELEHTHSRLSKITNQGSLNWRASRVYRKYVLGEWLDLGLQSHLDVSPEI